MNELLCARSYFRGVSAHRQHNRAASGSLASQQSNLRDERIWNGDTDALNTF